MRNRLTHDKNKALGFGLLAFVLCYVLFIAVFPTRCEDGWRSPSIGSQGACSWHGGVEKAYQQLEFWASVLVGWITFKLARRNEEK